MGKYRINYIAITHQDACLSEIQQLGDIKCFYQLVAAPLSILHTSLESNQELIDNDIHH